MELISIEIESYKSIKTPVTISFFDGLPTVLIGKNGSGKTNVLKALSAVALANTNYHGDREKGQIAYRAHIQLTEEDVVAMLPEVVYDKGKCEVIAYSSGNDLKIDRLRSEYIVSSIKKEIVDIRDLALQLKDAVDLYEKQLTKISHDGYEELPIHCYNLKDENGGLTNYNTLSWHAKYFIDRVRETLDSMLRTFEDDETALTFIAQAPLYWRRDENRPFRLEYIEPSLAGFERKFVSINRTAIKREITRINKATKDACERIDRLMKEIEERTKRIQEGLDTDYILRQGQDDRYYSFLRHVQHIIGKRCLILKNESSDVIFKKEDRNYYYNNHARLRLKDEQIEYYKDFKARQSTKMIGESLEQHCLTQFNSIRMTAFPNAYFEKDNDAKTGSKGDFIYRECGEDGTEFISIMFEMKNEADTTATKHKNEDFFKELDKDRKEKACEYAILVSLLEVDNELYNNGIVDVSYKYPKMYVIRPQFFIPIITLLRNAAQNSLHYRQELQMVRNQQVDILHFEDNMNAFKEGFARNYRLASEKFTAAIEEIDKTIDHLQKTKAALLSSENNLRLANNKADELSIKRLTKNAPTVKAMFDDLHRDD